jgi:subtilisin family serine protease
VASQQQIEATDSARQRSESVNLDAKQIITSDGKTYPLRSYRTFLSPNDPVASQWWTTPNNMNAVWDFVPSGPAIKIAIIDTGFALAHEELNGRWAVNAGEVGATALEAASDLNCTDQAIPLTRACNNIDDDFDGIVDNEAGATTDQNPSDLNCTDQTLPIDKSCNNIDDDDNGLKDDYRGWDFVNNDASVQAGEINPTGTGIRHGTMVAGVLGATGNNGLGISGVNWHAEILPIQALDDDSYGDSYTVGLSVRYAADQGAQIISISLGASETDPYLREAILYALDKGSLVVAASGNDGCNCISYPANYPEVVAVGALGSDGNPASFSSFGAELDLLAPGQSITTSSFSAASPTNLYASVSGTSFATPFTAGLLGLGRAAQPDASWEEIIGLMLENSDRRTLTASVPHSSTLGFGVARANTMLSRLSASYTASNQMYQLSGGTRVGSPNTYQCSIDDIPATPLYRLKKSNQYRYTANLRQLSKLVSQGWTASISSHVCMGLDTDTLDTLRTIDLPRETLNLSVKQ